eukprot:517593-Rhodomonas_salina.1
MATERSPTRSSSAGCGGRRVASSFSPHAFVMKRPDLTKQHITFASRSHVGAVRAGVRDSDKRIGAVDRARVCNAT